MANEPNVGQKTDTRFSYKTMESAMGNTGKMPPQALGFERAVLGALMIDRDTIPACNGGGTNCRGYYFYSTWT